jgi:hypothetical protein
VEYPNFGTQINLYEPAILIVGTRGRSLGGFQGLLPGSVSKYCLQHSPVPVIVVRPNSKREKARQKRVQENRHGYRDILDKSGPDGEHMIRSSSSHRSSIVDVPATSAVVGSIANSGLARNDAEAQAVAQAIGLDTRHPLAQVQQVGEEPTSSESGFSDDRDLSSPSSPEDMRSPGVVMKSPELENLDSPELTEEESSEDEEEDEEGDNSVAPGGVSVVSVEGDSSNEAENHTNGNKLSLHSTTSDELPAGSSPAEKIEKDVENIHLNDQAESNGGESSNGAHI